MLLQYCSDLHLEFPENKAFLKMRPLQPKAKILVLAGDIVPFQALGKHMDFFNYVSDNFEETYWIPGNHEYYGSDATERSGTFHERIKINVSLLNNMVVEEGNTRLVFTTLWSYISPRHQWDIERSLNDFSVIKFGGQRFRAAHVNQFHSESIDLLQGVLAQKTTQKTLVVSHHVPTFFNYPEIYKDSELNEAFGTELFDLISAADFAAWIYGHHHNNVADFTIGNTSMVTNQLGYVRNNEHRSFSLEKTLVL